MAEGTSPVEHEVPVAPIEANVALKIEAAMKAIGLVDKIQPGELSPYASTKDHPVRKAVTEELVGSKGEKISVKWAPEVTDPENPEPSYFHATMEADGKTIGVTNWSVKDAWNELDYREVARVGLSRNEFASELSTVHLKASEGKVINVKDPQNKYPQPGQDLNIYSRLDGFLDKVTNAKVAPAEPASTQ